MQIRFSILPALTHTGTERERDTVTGKILHAFIYIHDEKGGKNHVKLCHRAGFTFLHIVSWFTWLSLTRSLSHFQIVLLRLAKR